MTTGLAFDYLVYSSSSKEKSSSTGTPNINQLRQSILLHIKFCTVFFDFCFHGRHNNHFLI